MIVRHGALSWPVSTRPAGSIITHSRAVGQETLSFSASRGSTRDAAEVSTRSRVQRGCRDAGAVEK
jgi:hypothetical protein